LHSLFAGHNLDIALCIDLHASHAQPGDDYCPNGLGHVALPERSLPAIHVMPRDARYRAHSL
jgi:hypothetical protein